MLYIYLSVVRSVIDSLVKDPSVTWLVFSKHFFFWWHIIISFGNRVEQVSFGDSGFSNLKNPFQLDFSYTSNSVFVIFLIFCQ